MKRSSLRMAELAQILLKRSTPKQYSNRVTVHGQSKDNWWFVQNILEFEYSNPVILFQISVKTLWTKWKSTVPVRSYRGKYLLIAWFSKTKIKRLKTGCKKIFAKTMKSLPFWSVFAQICLSQANYLIIITTTVGQNISPSSILKR